MLHFKVGPFPVSVYPWFFITAVLLGTGYGFGWKMLAWILVVFVSVLVHELGHAVVGRAFGGRPEIRLEAFGGVTFPQFLKRPGPGRQFVLSVAGPVSGLLLGAAAYLLVRAWPPDPRSVSAFFMRQFMWVSVVWAAFNLLPILPLDGGNMMLAFLEGVRRKPSLVAASWISVAFAVLVGAGLTWALGPDPFLLLFLALFALQNFQRARLAGEAGRAPAPAAAPSEDATERADVAAATEEARNALLRRDLEAALAAVARLENAGGPFRQAAALRLRAGIELSRGDNESAAMLAGQSFSIWQSADAAVVAARANLRAGAEDRARNWLRRAVEAGAPAAAVRSDPELGAIA
ncbi:MAG TPA: site-2 protease family protein [Myxococcales bacterium]|nr:site-2 protease family protein [Myxococcales bacterium]